MIEYLEELYEYYRVILDYIILLLNCYVKLKDIDKLEKFIKFEGDFKFDFDIVILMCW